MMSCDWPRNSERNTPPSTRVGMVNVSPAFATSQAEMVWMAGASMSCKTGWMDGRLDQMFHISGGDPLKRLDVL